MHYNKMNTILRTSIASSVAALAAIFFGAKWAPEPNPSSFEPSSNAEPSAPVPEDPIVTAFSQLLAPLAAVTPVGVQASAIGGATPVAISSGISDRFKTLFAKGMETDSAGWHVLLPVEFSIMTSGTPFPSIGRYITLTGWPFFPVDGVHGNDYYAAGSVMNSWPGGLTPQAAVSFERSFSSSFVQLSVVPDGGSYAIQCVFTPRVVGFLEALFAPKLTVDTGSTDNGYVDWFGVWRNIGDQHTQRRLVLVSEGTAYNPIDLDALFTEAAALGGSQDVIRLVATGLTQAEANQIVAVY